MASSWRWAFHGLATVLALVAVAVLGASRWLGLYSHQLLALVLFLGLLWGLPSRAWAGWRGSLGSVRDAALRTHAAVRASFWALCAVAMVTVFPRSSDTMVLMPPVVALGIGTVVLALLPLRRAYVGVTAALGAGALMLGVDLAALLLPEAAPVLTLRPPAAGEWLVVQGGRSPLQNHHRSAPNQHFALDLVQLVDGAIFDETQSGQAATHAWDAELFVPVDGVVVVARDGMEDADGPNFVTRPRDAAGNTVVIRSDAGPFVLFGHLRKDSVAVSENQRVAVGDRLGRVGNSGNTTMPHLHLQVQTHADLWDPRNVSLPFTFEGWGRLPERNDRVRGP